MPSFNEVELLANVESLVYLKIRRLVVEAGQSQDVMTSHSACLSSLLQRFFYQQTMFYQGANLFFCQYQK